MSEKVSRADVLAEEWIRTVGEFRGGPATDIEREMWRLAYCRGYADATERAAKVARFYGTAVHECCADTRQAIEAAIRQADPEEKP